MHMMMGGAGAVVLVIVLVGAVIGWTALLQYTPMLVGSVFVGMLVGLGAALASAWRERRAESAAKVPSPSPAKAHLMNCPHCMSPVDSENALCPVCFQDLKRNCPQCGRIVNAQSSCCPSCGVKLASKA